MKVWVSVMRDATHGNKAILRSSHAYRAACCREWLSLTRDQDIVPVMMMSTRDSGSWSSMDGSICHESRLGIGESEWTKLKVRCRYRSECIEMTKNEIVTQGQGNPELREKANR